ncbi:hypothetical protein [Streptomyces sp. NPDC060194]|uniref:hypothetical protein n=1 Tax=Streptomyces sp. NPDC060194 TaxID=3347069 RepID=UPI00365CC682
MAATEAATARDREQAAERPERSRTAGRRLRSGTVVLGGVGLLATALTACGSEPDKRCVDEDSYDAARGYKVVSSDDCGSSGKSKKKKRKAVGAGSRSGSGDAEWYYGGKESGGWVKDGSFDKDAVDRDGFGDDDDGSSGG